MTQFSPKRVAYPRRQEMQDGLKIPEFITPKRPKSSQFMHKRHSSGQIEIQSTMPSHADRALRILSRKSISSKEDFSELQSEESILTPTLPKALRSNNYQRPSSVSIRSDQRRKHETPSKQNSTIRRLRDSRQADSSQCESRSSFLTQSISFKSVSSISATSESLPSVITVDKRSMQTRSKFYRRPSHTAKLTESLLQGPLEPMNNLGSVRKVNQFIAQAKDEKCKFRKRNLKRYGDPKFETESSTKVTLAKPVFASETKLAYRRYKTNLGKRSPEELEVKLKEKSLFMRRENEGSHRLIEREWSLGCVFDSPSITESCTTKLYQESVLREVSPLIINFITLNAKRKKKLTQIKQFSQQIRLHLRKFISLSTSFLDIQQRPYTKLRRNTFKETDEPPLLDHEIIQWKSQSIERTFQTTQEVHQVKEEWDSRAHLEKMKTMSKKSSTKFPIIVLHLDPFRNKNPKYEVLEKRKSIPNSKLMYSFIPEDLKLADHLEKKVLSLLFKTSRSNLLSISNKSSRRQDQTGISYLHSQGPQTEITSPDLSLSLIENKRVLHEQISRILPEFDTMEDFFQKRNAIYPLEKILRPGNLSTKFNKLYKELRFETKWNIKTAESPRVYSRMGTFSQVLEAKMLNVFVEKKIVFDKPNNHDFEYHALLNINQHYKPIFIFKPVHKNIVPVPSKGKAIKSMINCGPQTLVSESSEELSSFSEDSEEIVANNSLKRKYSHQNQSEHFLKLSYPLKRLNTSFTGKLPHVQNLEGDEEDYDDDDDSSLSRESVKIEIKVKSQSQRTITKQGTRKSDNNTSSSRTKEEVQPIAHYRHKRFSIQSPFELI